MTIHAIQTKYHGYRFRSRLEARWAVFFDAAGLKWEYEKEGFNLGRAGNYLPDFWLPSLHCWFEVKGEEPEYSDVQKVEFLRDESFPVLLAVGAIGEEEMILHAFDLGDSSAGSSEHDVTWGVCDCHGLTFAFDARLWNKDFIGRFDFATPAGCCYPPSINPIATKMILPKLYTAARSARFEHGESGAP